MIKRDRKAPTPSEIYQTLQGLLPSLQDLDGLLSTTAVATAYIYIEGDVSTDAAAATIHRIDVQLRRARTVLSRSQEHESPSSGFYLPAPREYGLVEEAFVFSSYAGRHRAGGNPLRRQVGQVALWLLAAALAGHVGNRADVVLWQFEEKTFDHSEPTPPPLTPTRDGGQDRRGPLHIDIDLTLRNVAKLRDIEPDGASREGLDATVVVYIDDESTGRSVVIKFDSRPRR